MYMILLPTSAWNLQKKTCSEEKSKETSNTPMTFTESDTER